MDFNDNRFGGRNDKDRTVPPEENYYADNDFNFDLNNSNNNGSYYNRYRSENQNQFQYNEPPRQYNYNNANSFYNTDNGFSSSNDFLRDYEGRKAAEEFDRRPPVRKDRPSHNTPKKKKTQKKQAILCYCRTFGITGTCACCYSYRLNRPFKNKL